MLYVPPLRHNPTLQPHLKFCPKQAKTSYFDRYPRPKPNHTCWYLFINTVTEHQKSVHGRFPLLESNLDVWDGNRCFTNRLLKCLVPRATKAFTWSYMYKSIHISPPFQPYRHSNNYYWRFIQMTRLQTTWGSTPPQFFVSLLPFRVHIILVPTHPSRCQSACQSVFHPPQKCLNSKSSNHIIPRFKNHQRHGNNPHALRSTRNGQVIYHSQDG